MGWFNSHKCSFKLISKTYFPGVTYDLDADYYEMVKIVLEYATPKTSYLWECDEPTCRQTKVVVMLGKEVSLPKER